MSHGWLVGRASEILAVILPAGPALAEVADKVEEARANHWIITCALFLLTVVAAASGWRRALLLWPVTMVWSQVVFWTVWDWFDEIRREGTLLPLWDSGATATALILAPPVLAGLARWRQRTGSPSE